MSEIIYGNLIAENYRLKIRDEVAKLKAATGKEPALDVVIVGEDPASQIYVRNKEKAAVEAGIRSTVHRLPAETTQTELLTLIEELNLNPEVNGILVQLPLPKTINASLTVEAVFAAKDVDGFHPVNLGRLMTGEKGIIPCTPKGCLKLIKEFRNDLTGLSAVVVGRSTIVGKPMAQLLLNENCTVTVAHSKTLALPEVCKTADILVVAVGSPKIIKADMVKEGAIVIDVGINRLEDGTLCGDVDFKNVLPKCAAITPVPKGVGPMTIAMLLDNTVDAFCLQHGIKRDL